MSDGQFLLDLKTTEDASPSGFAHSVAKFGYHIQQAYYQRGAKAAMGQDLPFYFICVEKSAPYLTAVYELDAATVALGHQKIEEALKVYRQCCQEDAWPGYSDEIVSLSLPGYAKPKEKGFKANLGDLDEHIYLSTREAAKLAGKTSATILKWCKTCMPARKKYPDRRTSPWEVKVKDLKRTLERKGLKAA